MNQFERALKMNPVRLLKKIFCFEEIYTIAYRNRDGRTLLDSDLLSFQRIPYSDTFWYADPILVSYGGKEYLFMESFDMRTQLGSIACAAFDEDGKLSEPRVILQEPYHMSFPMVFAWKDALYMIPETSENGSLNLYRCEGDIYQWTLAASFPTKDPLVDTVVTACHDDRVELLSSAISDDRWFQYRWQKFALVPEEDGFRLEEDGQFNAGAEYRYADRMAGTVVRQKDRVILPTQESTEIEYGINLLLKDFTEKDIAHMPVLKKVTVDQILLPDVAQKDQIGVHSYALSDKLEVVDIRYFRFSPLSRMRKLWNMGRKLICTVPFFFS